MAHFARLDSNNIVLAVVVIDNNKLIENGQENEAKGVAFCHSLFDKDYPNVYINNVLFLKVLDIIIHLLVIDMIK